MDNANTFKICTQCGERKPLEDFYAKKYMKDGRASECKLCSNARARAYGASHKSEISINKKKYYIDNIELLTIKNHEYSQTQKRKYQPTVNATSNVVVK